MLLSKKLDTLLLELAWSLWTELGVAGLKRNHQNVLISLEELILLTVGLIEIDPRLRDESLDWCTHYHHLFSISRLKAIMKRFGNSLDASFTTYAATLNSLSHASWPLLINLPPLKLSLSGKSRLPSLKSPSLLNIRVRSLFGPGARADLITFFVTHADTRSSASDLVELGYSKRNLADILEEFTLSGLLMKSFLRNQQRYQLVQEIPLTQLLGPLPQCTPPWRLILEILLPLRTCMARVESLSESTQALEIHTLLTTLLPKLQELQLPPPSFNLNFQNYFETLDDWLLKVARYGMTC